MIIITQSLADAPFDYSHLRIIKYDIRDARWQVKLAERIRNTIDEVLRRPSDYVVFSGIETRESKMREHLKRIFFSVDCLLDKSDVITVDDLGNARAFTTWTFDAASEVFHVCENRAVDFPGRVEVLWAYDKLNGRHMVVLEFDRSPRHLSYFMFLTNFKKPGQRFVLETEMYLEHYLGNLARDGVESMVHQAAARSQIKYRRIAEEYRLPKLPKYAAATAQYINHPDQQMIGQTIVASETAEAYVLRVTYESSTPFREEVGVVIRANGTS